MNSKKPTILIVDDDPMAVRELGEYLANTGLNVRTAQNGEQAIQSMEKAPSEIVITDIIMPEKDGIELIIGLHKQYPSLPIIAISGGGQSDYPGYLKLARSMGASRTFTKPLDLRELLQTIQKLLLGSGQAKG